MYFLSSRTLRQIESAFANILDSQTVKQGEERLKELRQLEGYELLLATFISRTNVYNLRLLAVLELEKKMILEKEQSVWSLKTVYYSDSDKMAGIVLKLLTKRDNIKWAGEFLQCNYEKMGLVETVRLIEFIFRLLDDPQKANESIGCHFQAIYDSLWKVSELVEFNDQLKLLVLLCSGLFYENCLLWDTNRHYQQGKTHLMQRFRQHWQHIIEKCQHNVDVLLVSVIGKLLYNSQVSSQQQSFFQLLQQTLKSGRTNNMFRQRYLIVFLQFIRLNTIIFHSLASIFQFVQVLQQERMANNQRILISLNLTGQSWQNLASNEFDSKNEDEIRKIICELIEQIFDRHYESLVGGYQSKGMNQTQIHIELLPLISDYGLCNQHIQKIVPSMISSVVRQLQSYVSDCRLNSANKKELLDCIEFVEFIIKFKEKVQIELLPHVVCLFGQVAYQYPNFSSLCYSLMEQIWENLAFLPLNNLADFMIKHVNSLNQNEWGHKLKSYSCFLQLANYLEESYQYFSHAPASDELLNSTVSSHRIMLQLLKQTSTQNLDFGLIYLIIKLTSDILANRSLSNLDQAHEGLSINYLVCLIDKYALTSREAAQLVACHRYVTHNLMSHLLQDGLHWQINSQDHIFRIQLYYSELKYAVPHLSINEYQSYRKSLSAKVIQFFSSPIQQEYLKQQSNELLAMICQEQPLSSSD